MPHLKKDILYPTMQLHANILPMDLFKSTQPVYFSHPPISLIRDHGRHILDSSCVVHVSELPIHAPLYPPGRDDMTIYEMCLIRSRKTMSVCLHRG